MTQGGNAHIIITINNIFTLSSTHCEVVTTVMGYDGRGVICELNPGGNTVTIKNLADVSAGTSFSVVLQMVSTSSAATVSPTVTIRTYYGNNAAVD